MRIVAALAMSLMLAGCRHVAVDAYPTMPDARDDCIGLLGDLPPKVAGQPRQNVPGDIAGAWGDPPIILRCGVEKPEALRPDSQCNMVNGVGWFAEKGAGTWLFTTIGRRHYVSLEVPHEYQPAADALVDVADLVARHLPEKRPCV